MSTAQQEQVERTGPTRYGDYFWVVQTGSKSKKSFAGEVALHADEIEVTPSGALICWGHQTDGSRKVHVGFAPGEWLHFYAASTLDSTPVNADRWNGEWVRDS